MADRPPNGPGYEIPTWLIVLCFAFGLWPLAIVMILLNANNVRIPAQWGDRFREQGQRVKDRVEQDLPPLQNRAQRPHRFRKSPKSGRWMELLGGFGMFIFGTGLVEELASYGLLYPDDWAPVLSFFLGSTFLAFTGFRRSRLARRQRLYLGAIGQRSSIYLSDLAATAGVKEKVVLADFQRMLSEGILPAGFIDRASSRLVLTDQGYEPPEAPAREPVQSDPASEAESDSDDDAILREIRSINEAIPGAEMSRKIDRIEDITRNILAYQRQNPEKAGQLRQFLNYYLPTTLKLLRTYAQLDAQGVEGENITAAKERIETMMDKVVAGFERQLDQLFQADAMDIASDVQVLEQMLEKDGLGQGMTLGGQ